MAMACSVHPSTDGFTEAAGVQAQSSAGPPAGRMWKRVALHADHNYALRIVHGLVKILAVGFRRSAAWWVLLAGHKTLPAT